MKTTLATMQKHGGKTIDSGKQDGEPVFYYFGELLREQWCDEVCGSIRHTGWFTNDDGTTYKDGSGKARGIVVTLPARPGFPDGVFLAGYHWGDNGERVVWPECYADGDDAARAGDGYAESFAEDQREHDAQWNAARELEEKIDRKKARLLECLALRNMPCFGPLRDEAKRCIAAIRKARKTLETDYAGVL